MKNIKRYYILNAEPTDVYNALTNKKMLEIWTGETAEMEPVPEFEENKKIVQQWFFDNENVHSIVTMKLHPHKKGTSLELSHTNIPDEAYENISEGWDEDYFGALNELFI